MKKILSLALLFFASTSLVSADCMFQETPARCSVTGITFTNSCEGWSDTSSWSLPTAYEGVCMQGATLTQTQKDKIFLVLETFFKKQDMMGEVYAFETISIDPTTGGLNPQGQTFVNEKLFPNIKRLLLAEKAKTSPNLQTIAVLNYAAKIVGYDYYLQK